MRLKKQAAVLAFHSQLSAILEKVMVLAVEEIKGLVFDLCEEISPEEKSPSEDLSQKATKEQEAEIYHISDSFYTEHQDDHDESHIQNDQTSREDDEEEKEEPQQNYMLPKDFTKNETVLTACKYEQAATFSTQPSSSREERDCSHEESRHSNFEPPGDSKNPLSSDYTSADESQSLTYEEVPTNHDDSIPVEFHIKQEEESPAFEKGRNIDHYDSNAEPEINFDSFDVRHEETLGSPMNNTGTMLDMSSFSLPDQQMNACIFSQQRHGHLDLRLPPSKQIKKYACDFCNKTFCYPSDLKHHRLWHTRERTHVCQICGKAFITRSHLRRHELMHLDVQPSVCQICGYKTSRMVYLKEHMKIHKKTS